MERSHSALKRSTVVLGTLAATFCIDYQRIVDYADSHEDEP